jgi:hypothetical protein
MLVETNSEITNNKLKVIIIQLLILSINTQLNKRIVLRTDDCKMKQYLKLLMNTSDSTIVLHLICTIYI